MRRTNCPSSKDCCVSTTSVRSGVLGGQGRRGEPLGFGFAEAAALVTPVVWLVLDQVARRGLDVATEGLMERWSRRVRGILRRGAGEPPVELPTLGRAELALVRERILERAVERGMDRAEAEALADGVIARLGSWSTACWAETRPPSGPGRPPWSPTPCCQDSCW
ncbi:hypothetical protein ACFRMN_09080 [Streptomyces sp. NPDC056835]|uniref:hypothetical protein n=1 Tax=Streptomyces sp. NPDC056835 TaxID=3345956 RepID=UPI003696D873